MSPFIRKRIKRLLGGSQANRDFLLRWCKKDNEVLKYVMFLRGIDPKKLKEGDKDELLVEQKG